MDRGLPLTRRTLLAAGGAGAATLAAGGLLRAGSGGTASAAAQPLVRSAFAPHVGSVFELADPGGATVRARLDAVEDLTSGRAGSEDQFHLLFHGPRAPLLPQSVAEVRHGRLGTSHLLVSPSGTGRRGQDYSVIVNRPFTGRL